MPPVHPAVSIHLRGVTFAHSAAVPVLHGLDLDLHPGWTGLVGANGSGKSTLLALLAGVLRPDEGRVDVTSAVPPVLVDQRVEQRSSAVEEFALDWDGPAARLRARLELDPDRVWAWDTLSPGERTRWKVGAALCARPDVLLLDEPTNHLDAHGRSLLVDTLRRHGGVGVVVSHDRALLDELTTTTVRLVGRGGAECIAASYSVAQEAWEREAAAAAATEQLARREEARLRRVRADARRERERVAASGARLRRQAGHRDTDAREAGRKMAGEKAQASLERRVAAIDARVRRASADVAALDRPPTVGGLTLRPGAERRRVLAVVQADALAPDGDRPGPADHVVLRDVEVCVERGARVHLAGRNGAGKSTLLRALARVAPDAGVLRQEPPGAVVRADLDDLRRTDPELRGRILGAVAVLGVDPDRLLTTADPSPGEARKLALARLLVTEHDLLLLDEPTNHLDLPAVEALQDALVAFPGALVLATHDDAVARATTTHRWRVEDGAVRVSPAAP